MTATAPCSRCGAHHLVGARRCDACGSALGDPFAARWRRALGAAALAVLISVAGAWAIYEIHRGMPAVPPGFERLVRVAAAPPSPVSGDEARLRHLQRPEPGSGFMAPPAAFAPPAAPGQDAPASRGPAEATAPTPAQTPGAAALAAAPVARSGERLAAIQQSLCGDQTLLARIVCNERVRLRYCRDRWNEHPDCEAISPPNTGN